VPRIDADELDRIALASLVNEPLMEMSLEVSVLLAAVGTVLYCGDGVADDVAAVQQHLARASRLPTSTAHHMRSSRRSSRAPRRRSASSGRSISGAPTLPGLVALVDLLGEPTRVRGVPGQNTLALDAGEGQSPGSHHLGSGLDEWVATVPLRCT
jgi:hypothetical protein